MRKDKTATLEKKRFKLPDTWIVVFIMVVIVAILSWIVPAGSYDYHEVEINGTIRNLAIDGSYHVIDKAETSPTGFLGVFSALYSGCVGAASTIFMVLCCCSCFRIMVRTGAFHAGIGSIMKRLGKKGLVIVVLLMIVFGLCGSMFGMLSELFGFYPLIVGLGVALGYDAMFGFAILALGEYIGFTAGTLNPYNVAISQGISEVPLYSNLPYRWLCFAVLMGISMAYLLWYGIKIRRDPTRSIVYGRPCIHSFSDGDLDQYKMTPRYALILVDLAVVLVVLMGGNERLCGLFILMSIIGALISGWSGQKYVDEFVEGVKGMAWGALIAGLSYAIMVVMNNAMITDTIIHGVSSLLEGKSPIITLLIIYAFVTLFNFFVSSGSGKAVVMMPILEPLGQVLGINQQVLVLAYQYGDGFTNTFWPTAALLQLSLCGMDYGHWFKFAWKIYACLIGAGFILVVIANQIGYGPF